MKRLADFVGMIMIGDGVLGLMRPERHSALWNCGPKPYRKFVDELELHPRVTRGLGLALVGLGLWVACRAEKGLNA